MQNSPSNFCIFVVSVDIVLDSKWGNIADPQVRAFWLHAIQECYVLGVLVGPPCETLSKARERALAGMKGPRAVRDGDHPWALPSLSLHELRQVSLGNVLLGFALEALVWLACTGGLHPARLLQAESSRPRFGELHLYSIYCHFQVFSLSGRTVG